jgi:hypothetical protein
MASNPPPSDLAEAQAVTDESTGQLRWRREDERTAAGAGVEHNKFIVCHALGVSLAIEAGTAQYTHLHRYPCEPASDARDSWMRSPHAPTPLATRAQISLKSTAKPGRDGKNIKQNDFKFSRKAYWVTSREAPNVLWIEELLPSSEAVKAFVVRDKEYATTDAEFLDSGDSFDSFLRRWADKSLNKEYDQAPIKVGDVGKVYPHWHEVEDLLLLTKESDVWTRFLETGDQDLDGFDGDLLDEVCSCLML